MTDSTTTLAPPPESRIRDDIARLVLGNLRGPLSGDPREELVERPSIRYILGTLAPQRDPETGGPALRGAHARGNAAAGPVVHPAPAANLGAGVAGSMGIRA